MSKYEFQSSLYRNQSEMLSAIADAWLTAGGQNDSDDITGFLEESTDEELADECVNGWNLAERSGDQELDYENEDDVVNAPWVAVEDSHMDKNGYDVDALVNAFSWFRADRPDLKMEAEETP